MTLLQWIRSQRGLAAGLFGICLVSCGGGDPGAPVVNNMQATNVVYGSTMTVSAVGVNLNSTALRFEANGCTDAARSALSTDTQVSYTCTVSGAGAINPTFRDSAGAELARVAVAVPVPQVTISVTQGTRSGSLVVELNPAAAPITSLNFMRYVTSGFYTNTLFHRVLAGQLAQGGGYTNDLTQKQATFAPITLESNNGLTNLRGTIAMARTSDPNSATSQFYFNVRDNPAFDRLSDELPGYAVFGRIVKGLEDLDELSKVPVTTTSAEFAALPVQNVVITSITKTQ